MSRLDLVIFGATGFTGAKAVEEMVRVGKKHPELTWGVAGRSQSKLESLMANIAKKTGEDLSSIRIIVAEVSDEKSIQCMCEQARVIANCCGPYRLYGEPVVKAAIAAKTHVVDVTGEIQMVIVYEGEPQTKYNEFIETMQLKYDQEAREAGVYIVSACGFDSIPNDLGLVYMQQHFDGTLNSVDSYVSFNLPVEFQSEAVKKGIMNYGTWESIVYVLAYSNEVQPLRKKLFPDRLPSLKPKLPPRSIVHKHKGQWYVPFLGTDESVVYRTQRYFYERENKRPVQFRPYCKMPSLLASVVSILAAVIIFLMSKTSFTMKLLLKYPRVFSLGYATREGPTDNVINNIKFQFELCGEGWEKNTEVESNKPNKKAVVKVKGVNPGYGATVTGLIFSAITCLQEPEKMPGTGGVLTTGAAFSKTNLIKHLNENNLTFEIEHI